MIADFTISSNYSNALGLINLIIDTDNCLIGTVKQDCWKDLLVSINKFRDHKTISMTLLVGRR